MNNLFHAEAVMNPSIKGSFHEGFSKTFFRGEGFMKDLPMMDGDR